MALLVWKTLGDMFHNNVNIFNRYFTIKVKMAKVINFLQCDSITIDCFLCKKEDVCAYVSPSPAHSGRSVKQWDTGENRVNYENNIFFSAVCRSSVTALLLLNLINDLSTKS